MKPKLLELIPFIGWILYTHRYYKEEHFVFGDTYSTSTYETYQFIVSTVLLSFILFKIT